MYIIEKIIKFCMDIRSRDKVSYSPVININKDEAEDYVTCRHTFMPVDSTKNIYACTKCGYLITKKRLEMSKKKAIKKKSVGTSHK